MATKNEREKRRAARQRKTAKIKQELEELLKDNDPEPEPEPEEDEELIPLEDEDEEVEDEPEPAIVNNFNLTINEKADSPPTVSDLVSEIVETDKVEAVEKSNDLDIVELEAMIARDSRHLSLSEKVADWLVKAKLTASAENALSDSDFALVVTRGGKKVRKYPIHDKAHVRNALARAAQMMKRGGQAASDAKAALPKIHAAAKKMGIGMMEKEGGILIEKDASGSWRWVGWPTNNFIDHSNDIITEAAHLDYVDWINKDIANNAPVFTSCHAPGTVRTYPVDFAAYENGFVVMSGKLTEDEAVALLKASAKCDIGMSHTSWGLRDKADPRQVVKYRAFEITDLPLETADNPFTFMELSKEVDMNQLEYLTNLLGSKEKAEKALKLKTEMKQKELQEAGVESKEKAESKLDAKETAPDLEKIVKEVFERVSKELDMEGLSAYLSQLQESAEKVTVLETLVKELAGKQDEKLAEMIEPPAAKTLVWQKARASQSKDTVLKEGVEADEKLKKSVPELGWLSEISKTTPIQA